LETEMSEVLRISPYAYLAKAPFPLRVIGWQTRVDRPVRYGTKSVGPKLDQLRQRLPGLVARFFVLLDLTVFGCVRGRVDSGDRCSRYVESEWRCHCEAPRGSG